MTSTNCRTKRLHVRSPCLLVSIASSIIMWAENKVINVLEDILNQIWTNEKFIRCTTRCQNQSKIKKKKINTFYLKLGILATCTHNVIVKKLQALSTNEYILKIYQKFIKLLIQIFLFVTLHKITRLSKEFSAFKYNLKRFMFCMMLYVTFKFIIIRILHTEILLSITSGCLIYIHPKMSSNSIFIQWLQFLLLAYLFLGSITVSFQSVPTEFLNWKFKIV